MDSESKKSIFRGLLCELNAQSQIDDGEVVCNLELPEDLPVRVYYVHSDQEVGSRPTFGEYLRSIETSRNLCDIRHTFKARNRNKEKNDDVIIITPSDDTTTRVLVFYKVESHFAEIKINRSSHRLGESLQIGKRIQQDYAKFRSFVVIDRFEHMEYVATGLSLICKNLGKLVIFTGGTDEINEPNSSSATCLSQSLFIASSRD